MTTGIARRIDAAHPARGRLGAPGQARRTVLAVAVALVGPGLVLGASLASDGSGVARASAAPAIVGADVVGDVPDELVGALDWPAPSRSVVRAFEAPESRWGPGHRGIDVAAEPGVVVTAAADGVVHFAGTVVDRPVITIRLADDRWEVLATVEPVAPDVEAGDAVRTGDPIGTLLPGHRPCGACVHLGVRVDGAYVNPMALLGAERSVLLPLGDAAHAPGSAARGRAGRVPAPPRGRRLRRADARSGTRW